MATVTKLKASVNNNNLPILMEDGSLTNYYFGMFLTEIVKKGYIPTAGEKTALNNFVESAINNGYIDYIQYLLPFIGDSNNPTAGVVPLIDNVDGYNMSEYSGTENYSSFFEFDSLTGKIKSVHNNMTSEGPFIKTPVTYNAQNRGVSAMMNLNVGAPTYITIPILSQDVVEGNVTYYIRSCFKVSNSSRFGIVNSASDYFDITKINHVIPDIVSNRYNANIAFSYFKKDSDEKLWGGNFYEFSGTKNYSAPSRTSVDAWVDKEYGKYMVGRSMKDINLKCLAFIKTDIPRTFIEQMSSDVFALVNALGRNS